MRLTGKIKRKKNQKQRDCFETRFPSSGIHTSVTVAFVRIVFMTTGGHLSSYSTCLCEWHILWTWQTLHFGQRCDINDKYQIEEDRENCRNHAARIWSLSLSLFLSLSLSINITEGSPVSFKRVPAIVTVRQAFSPTAMPCFADSVECRVIWVWCRKVTPGMVPMNYRGSPLVIRVIPTVHE